MSFFLQAYDGVEAQSTANKNTPASGHIPAKHLVTQPLITCNNWLRTQAVGQSVKIGDLDVTGNTMTVEAQYNRVLPAANSYIPENIVS